MTTVQEGTTNEENYVSVKADAAAINFAAVFVWRSIISTIPIRSDVDSCGQRAMDAVPSIKTAARMQRYRIKSSSSRVMTEF